ncbi:MAG: hypothetical protein LBT40_15265 [Deltaproteobacteria bacterium]|nr:hypothetical protein [Deltaproteobacteria bacterium]
MAMTLLKCTWGMFSSFVWAVLLAVALSTTSALAPGMALGVDGVVTDDNIDDNSLDFDDVKTLLLPYDDIIDVNTTFGGWNVPDSGIVVPLGTGDEILPSGNSITIKDQLTDRSVVGGLSIEIPSAVVTGNTVDIYNDIGSYKQSYPGRRAGSVYGGLSTHAKVSSNTVNIHGGDVADKVYGGRSIFADVSSNTVNISGGTISYIVPINRSMVYGGSSIAGNITENTVNISGDTTMTNSDAIAGHTVAGSSVSKNKLLITRS